MTNTLAAAKRQERVKFKGDMPEDGIELLEAIGRKRGLLVRGGEVNTERCAIMLVDEFRACKWGRISLERPPQRDDLADFAEEDEE